jgi:hypothetical protein
VVELTALLREGPGGDHLATWPEDLRIICRREKPHPGAQLSLVEAADGWRYQLLATNTHPPPPRSSLKARLDRTPEWKTTSAPPSTPAWDTSRRPRAGSPGLVCRRHHRRRPAVLVTAAVPRRATGQSRTQNPALPAGNTPPLASSAANANAQSASLQPGPGHANSPLASLPPSVYPHQHNIDQHHPAPNQRNNRGTGGTRRSPDATVGPAA